MNDQTREVYRKLITEFKAGKDTSNPLYHAFEKGTPGGEWGSGGERAYANEVSKVAQNYIKWITNPGLYVDFGCGDGAYGFTIARDIKAVRFVQCDLTDNRSPDYKGSEFITSLGALESKSVDLMSCFMVLHHIPEPELTNVMNEIKRVIKVGGTVLIREHSETDANAGMIIVHHLAYDRNMDFDAAWKKNWLSVRTAQEWTTLFSKFGFRSIKMSQPSNNFKKAFFASFKLT